MVDSSSSSRNSNSMKIAKVQFKDAENTQYFDHVNVPPSLETLALFTVLRKTWFQYDKDLIKSILNPMAPGSAPYKKKVCEDLRKLDLPKIVLDEMIHYCNLIEEELRKITYFLSDFNVKLKSYQDLKWTGWGVIDKYKTFLKVIRSGKYKSQYLERALNSSLLHTSLDSTELIKAYVYHRPAFNIFLRVGIEAEFSHNLKRLTCDEKDDYIFEKVKKLEEYSRSNILLNENGFCLLFFNMGNKKRLIDIISKNQIMVHWLLSWPWKFFFEKYLEENYLEYFCNASQVDVLKKKDQCLFERLSKNTLIQKHFNKLLSEGS